MEKQQREIEKNYTWDDFFPQDHSHHVFRSKFKRSKGCFYHTQDFYDLTFIEEGNGTHEINGNAYKIGVGDVLIISPRDAHRISSSTKNELCVTNIGLRLPVVEHARERYPEEFAWFHVNDHKSAPFKLDLETLQAVNELIDKLSHEPRNPAAIDRFLLNLTKLIPERYLEQKSAPDWLINARETFRIERPLVEGVDKLVELSGKTPAHVSRSMKRFFDQTPTEFVNTLRLQSVTHQLLMSTKSVEEIAYQCGFNNLPHFFKLFREAYEESPLQYRRSHQQSTLGQ